MDTFVCMNLSHEMFWMFVILPFQVVTLVLYTYFTAALLGRQMIPKPDGYVPSGKYEDPDLYFPLFTALQVNFSSSAILFGFEN